MDDKMLTYECAEFKLFVMHEIDRFNISEQNIDFNITVGGDTYAGTAVTLKNIEFLMEKFQTNGECNYGRYFWQHNMLILAEMSFDCLYTSLLDIVRHNSVDLLDEMFFKISSE